ncbi:MAG: hypothetical protein OEY51_04830, partial [Cyclobacteriaceae bacterium]|nr:hypothetical protein [Cyclobacteriaceae bacterium]
MAIKDNIIIFLLIFLSSTTLISQKKEASGAVTDEKALSLYNEILSTRNPHAVLDIISSFDIKAVEEDSLRSYFYYYKGSAYGQIARFDSAFHYLVLAEVTLPENENPEIEIQIIRAYGNVNWARNFYHLALKNYEDALNISNKLDHAEFQISLLGNIAGIYAKLENLPLALEYALKAEVISDRTGVIRPRSHMKIGTYLNELGEYEKALISLNKTRNIILKEGKDSIALGVNYINIATSNFELGR